MNRFFAALCGVALVLLLALPASAAVIPEELSGALREGLRSSGADGLSDELPDETRQLLEDINLSSPSLPELLALSPGDFVRLILDMLREWAYEPVRTLGAIMGVCVLCSLVASLCAGDKTMSSMFSIVAALCVIGSIAKPISECIMAAAGALQDCARFTLSFIPVFCSIVTVSGAPITATGYNLFLFAMCQVVSSFASGVLVPFMGIYMGLCIAGGVSEDIGVLPLARGVRSFVTWSLTLTMTAFVGLLSAQTLVASGADNAMMKTGKFIVGSFVPIVGGAISDALSAASAAVGLLKTTVGAFGIIVLALIFIPILLKLLLWYLTVKVGAFVADTLSLRKLSGLLGACSECLSTLLALLFCFMLVIIISVVLLLSFSSGV